MDGDEQRWACAECARRCSKIHGKRASTSNFSFFKVMLGHFRQCMVLPPKFARLLGDLVGENIYLKNSIGQSWEVKLSKVDDCLAFEQGWNEFASYHSIKVGEFLVFKYVSNSNFVVQVFGKSGCERSHFCESIDDNVRGRCSTEPTDYLYLHKDERKFDTCTPCCCLGDKVPDKEKKSTNTAPCESFSTSQLRCETDGIFHKRKRPATCLCPHKNGRKRGKSAVHCCPKDDDSARKRKAIRTAPCEFFSSREDAVKDTGGDFNIPKNTSSHNMNTNGPQTTTAVDYSEAPCVAVSEDLGKGQEGSQMAPTDIFGNLHITPVGNAEKGWEGNEVASFDICTHVNASHVDFPELLCKVGKTNSCKQQETILALPSEFIPAESGTENGDKMVIIEEKSPNHANLKKSHPSCGKKLKENKNKLPSAENTVNMTHSPTKMGISLTSCVETLPTFTETNLSKELGCKNLVVESPNPESTDQKVEPEEDKSAAAKDNILGKATTNNGFTGSPSMPASKCSVDVGENLGAYDMATYRLLVNNEGTCYIVRNSIGDPESISTSTKLPNAGVNEAKSKDSFVPTAKEVSFCCDKEPCLPAIFGCRNELSSSEAALIDTNNNGYYAQKGHFGNLGNNTAAISEENYTLLVKDASQDINKVLKCQEGSSTLSGSCERGVKQDAILQKSEEFKPKAVKTEIMDPDDLPSPNSTNFSFSLVVNNLSSHDLSEPLPSNCGKKRHERKVVLLRDPAMRVWPVLYHESFNFIGLLGGWETFVTANNIRKGDTCHIDTVSHMESMLQVQISRAPDD